MESPLFVSLSHPIYLHKASFSTGVEIFDLDTSFCFERNHQPQDDKRIVFGYPLKVVD